MQQNFLQAFQKLQNEVTETKEQNTYENQYFYNKIIKEIKNNNKDQILSEIIQKIENLNYDKQMEQINEKIDNINYDEEIQEIKQSLENANYQGQIEEIKEQIKYKKEEENKKSNNIINLGRLFMENRKKTTNVFSIDEFVDAVGVNMTWIRSLALWEEDCKDLRVLKDNAHTQMAQIPLLLYQVESKGHAVIYDEPIMDSLPVEKKNLTYGLHQVFYNNFLGHLRTYLNKGYLSKSCYERLRKKLLLEFFCNWIIIKENNDGQYIFSDENLQRLIESEYKRDNYYLVFKAKLFKMRVASFVNKYVRPKRNQKN